MTDDARADAAGTAERVAGFVYGTIVALAVVVAGARAYPHQPGHIAALVAITSVALWLGHVYARALGHSVGRNEHLRLAELRRIASHERSIIEAAIPPVAALLLGTLGVLSTQVAVWTAFGLGLAVLLAQGVTVARVEHLGLLGTLGVVAANIGLGVLLVAVKLAVTH